MDKFVWRLFWLMAITSAALYYFELTIPLGEITIKWFWLAGGALLLLLFRGSAPEERPQKRKRRRSYPSAFDAPQPRVPESDAEELQRRYHDKRENH